MLGTILPVLKTIIANTIPIINGNTNCSREPCIKANNNAESKTEKLSLCDFLNPLKMTPLNKTSSQIGGMIPNIKIFKNKCPTFSSGKVDASEL